MLALEKGTVTDLSGRTFENITAFQYALWAMDWHMWKMLQKYISPEAAALQLQELEEKGTAHGKHFSLSPLIEALDTYVKNFDGWYKASNWTAIETHWCRQVGGTQLLVPAHVAQEYCHPSRPFSPCPDFSADVQFPRSMKTDEGEWFTAVYNGGTLGIKFGFLRYFEALADAAAKVGNVQRVGHDREVLQCLLNTRQQQLLGLKKDLASRIEPMIGLGR